MKRQRATVIVEIERRILLVENRGGLVLLPGGGINPEESPAQAAVRELGEETGLTAASIGFLFAHESATNCHQVYLAQAAGQPRAGDGSCALHFLGASDDRLDERMSLATRTIIERFRRLAPGAR